MHGTVDCQLLRVYHSRAYEQPIDSVNTSAKLKRGIGNRAGKRKCVIPLSLADFCRAAPKQAAGNSGTGVLLQWVPWLGQHYAGV